MKQYNRFADLNKAMAEWGLELLVMGEPPLFAQTVLETGVWPE